MPNLLRKKYLQRREPFPGFTRIIYQFFRSTKQGFLEMFSENRSLDLISFRTNNDNQKHDSPVEYGYGQVICDIAMENHHAINR